MTLPDTFACYGVALVDDRETPLSPLTAFLFFCFFDGHLSAYSFFSSAISALTSVSSEIEYNYEVASLHTLLQQLKKENL